MNILVIAPHGMYQNYTASFIHNQAKEYVRQGNRVRAVIPLAIAKRSNEGKRTGPSVEMLWQDGVELCYVRHLSLSNYGERWFNGRSLRLALRILASRVLRDFQPDVIHAHTIGFGTVAGELSRRCGDAPVVITTHGGDTNVAVQPENRTASKAHCDQAAAVVAVSEQLAEKVRLLGSSARVVRIFNGFAAEHICSAEKKPFHIVQAGQLKPSKHAELTIRAVAALRERYPELSLTLVGDGPQRGVWENLCCELELDAETVRFAGQLSNSQTLSEMAKARFFCMPSFPEGFGIVYPEAMASGCIAIGTEGEGISDLIVSGENGFLVPPGDQDAIVRVIDDCLRHPEEASAVAERGREDAMKLTWENNAKQYLELFRSLCNQ